MPFIRYEIVDLGSIERSNGGRYDKLITLNGRLNDFAILPSGKKVPGFTLYYVSRQILEKSGIVKEYVIKQISSASFVFEIVSENSILDKDKALIISTMEQYLEPGISIEIKRVEKIDRLKSGKLKHFISLVSN
jgi:phenylacetate-CoA ligase